MLITVLVSAMESNVVIGLPLGILIRGFQDAVVVTNMPVPKMAD